MNKELGRKITSLTIMTIMVAGGLTFAVPGMMPGAEVEVRRVAPLGDPMKIQLRGASVSLRKQEAAIIEVEVL